VTALWWVLGTAILVPFLNFLIGVRPPTFQTDDHPARYGLRYESVAFQTADGLTLRGWLIPASSDRGRSAPEPSSAPPEACGTIIVGHGYPFDKANILRHALFLHARFHLLLLDFRYFGDSDGAYTTAGLLETQDVAAAVSYLEQRNDVDPERVGALGFSMSAAAFLLARHPGITAIVADSAYATLEDLIGSQFFFLPGPLKWPPVALTKIYAKLLLGVNVGDAAPVEAVRTLRTPLLLIHGEADSQIPVEHAHRLAANTDPTLTEVWIVPGADHGHAHALEGPRYEARVLRFFTRHLCEKSTLHGP